MENSLKVEEFRPEPEAPQPNVVAELEFLLKGAREGRIRTLGVVYSAGGDTPKQYEVSWRWVGERGWRTALVGGIAALQKMVLDSLCEES